MKKIEAIIRKSKFEDVKEALLEADIEWFSFYGVRGIGKSREARVYRGVMYDTSSIERMLISVVVREKNVETNMVFNSCIGPQGWVHWFFNDGFTKRKDRLVVNFIKADKYCNFSLNDTEWHRLKVHFGIPVFNGYLFKHFKSQKELKHGGKNPKTVDC